MKAYVEAYGCTLNFGEARELEDHLLSRGWELAGSPDACDLAVLVTCVVIETTERAMLKRIGELTGVPNLVITGCMATTCRERAQRIAPNAVFVPPGDLEEFSHAIEDTAGPVVRPDRERKSYCIVPIATGCLGSCAYCITRLARGRLRSRPASRILSAVEEAAGQGPREIQVTAQDTAAYGTDIGTSLPELVSRICQIPLDFRLRIGMMNPKSAIPLAEEIAEMYAQPKVFKFLHLPAQSASDKLLDRMERGYTLEGFKKILSTVRARVPEVTLSTDLIVGYPGETAEDHAQNLDFISEARPDIVNITRFSARPGTKAAGQKPVVGWMAKERSRELTELRFRIALEKNRSWVGRAVRALSTEIGKNRSTILRTDEYKQVVVPETLSLGRYYEVHVTGATPTYLTGLRAEGK
ncbi:MAG: tRNA (N(6)-L-threonylcarbamoyladenosine(37)-C(2))-methylthiotransferase [Thermoplasmata archaeon]